MKTRPQPTPATPLQPKRVASEPSEAPVRVQRMVRHRSNPPVLLVEPIDCEALANAFMAARWRWRDGYPTANRIAEAIAKGKADLAMRPGQLQSCNSGGIKLERRDGEIVVLVDTKLAAQYQKPKMPNGAGELPGAKA